MNRIGVEASGAIRDKGKRSRESSLSTGRCSSRAISSHMASLRGKHTKTAKISAITMYPMKHNLSRLPGIQERPLTTLDHLLQTPIRINLHREQVIESVHLCGVFPEFLGKGIGEVMCWIGGLGFRSALKFGNDVRELR